MQNDSTAVQIRVTRSINSKVRVALVWKVLGFNGNCMICSKLTKTSKVRPFSKFKFHHPCKPTIIFYVFAVKTASFRNEPPELWSKAAQIAARMSRETCLMLFTGNTINYRFSNMHVLPKTDRPQVQQREFTCLIFYRKLPEDFSILTHKYIESNLHPLLQTKTQPNTQVLPVRVLNLGVSKAREARRSDTLSVCLFALALNSDTSFQKPASSNTRRCQGDDIKFQTCWLRSEEAWPVWSTKIGKTP